MKRLVEPVGILGFGIEGKSSLAFLQRNGYQKIVIMDRAHQEPLLKEIHSYSGEKWLEGLEVCRTIIRSPGIRPDLPEILKFIEQGGKQTSQTEIFLESHPREKTICVTGTLGKGTCCSLITEIIKRAGLQVYLGGNIGKPALDILDECNTADVVVLELSSFQLAPVKATPKFAVVLKTTSEHLDWHLDRNEYIQCKARITKNQRGTDWLVFHSDSEGSQQIAAQSKAKKTSYGLKGEIGIKGNRIWWPEAELEILLDQLKLTGEFQLENVAAALGISHRLGIPTSTILEAIKDFTGLEHRMEFIGKNNSFAYYNDSYATRPDATIGAINAFSGKQIGLILGGSEKYADFKGLIDDIAKNSAIHAISYLGVAGIRIQKLLTPRNLNIPQKQCENLEEAIGFLENNMKKGVILLSPACASFGMFRNYRERGKIFKQLVQAKLELKN